MTSKEYYAANKEHLQEYNRNRYAKNKDKIRERTNKQRRENYAKNSKPFKKRYNKWYESKGKDPNRLRHKNLKSKYGITNEEYNKIVIKQENRCAMEDCKVLTPGRGNKWFIDHDPVTGKVRGLLCMQCNLKLGHYEKSRNRHKAFDNYLKQSIVT